MLLKIFLTKVVLLSALVAVSCQRQDNDCVASAGSVDSCMQFIYSSCENATFTANRSAYSEQCSPVSLFWDAPVYNMTILFKSQLMKPYSICVEPVGCVKAYRTLDDGREVMIE